MNLHRRVVLRDWPQSRDDRARKSGSRPARRSRRRRISIPTRFWNGIRSSSTRSLRRTRPNSSSQRLGAIVHTAIFDAYNGIERRYTPIFVQNVDGDGERLVPPGASRRAAVIAAAYTTLVALFPTRAGQLGDSYAASLAALSDDGGDGGQITRARHRVGDTGGAGRTRLARGRWLQRDLPVIHRRNSGWPVASDSAGLVDDRARVGVHGAVRGRKQHAVPARHSASARERYVHGGLQRREGAGSPNRIDAH